MQRIQSGQEKCVLTAKVHIACYFKPVKVFYLQAKLHLIQQICE